MKDMIFQKREGALIRGKPTNERKYGKHVLRGRALTEEQFSKKVCRFVLVSPMGGQNSKILGKQNLMEHFCVVDVVACVFVVFFALFHARGA